jgi:predicted extracellular nuclease
VREKNKKEVSIGSLNLFRLFDDFDDAPITNALGETINDQVVSSEEYQRRLTKIARFVVNEMKTPDVLAVQEVEKLGVLEDLADAISILDKKSKYRAFLSEGNDIGSIDVGFLVRKKTKVRSVTQLGAAETFIETSTGRLDLLHDRPPLLLEIKSHDFEMYVMVVHNRSLGGITTARVQQKRFEQAQSIARMVQELQSEELEAGLVVIGDFNAFEFTDSYVDAVGQISGFFNPADNLLSGADLVDPDLMNQVLLLPENERYSFVFRGNAQTLDHALTNQVLDLRVRGLQFARGNADAAVDLINDEASPLRVSDHDGLVLFVYTGELEEDEEEDEDDEDEDEDEDEHEDYDEDDDD